MAPSAGANITGLNHTLQQLITQLALYKLEIPGKVPKTEVNREYACRIVSNSLVTSVT